MGKRLKMKRITFFSAIISLISFLYKMGLGIYTLSLVLMIASLSTLFVFICKVAFVKTITSSRDNKRKAYLVTTVSAFLYSLLFLLFVVLKLFDIDISRQTNYQGWIEIVFIGFIFLMFILSIINLKGALEKTDIIVIGLKEITFISALTDLVIIEEFVSRIVLKYVEVEIMPIINSYFCLGISVIMLLIPIIMIVRWARYKV